MWSPEFPYDKQSLLAAPVNVCGLTMKVQFIVQDDAKIPETNCRQCLLTGR